MSKHFEYFFRLKENTKKLVSELHVNQSCLGLVAAIFGWFYDLQFKRTLQRWSNSYFSIEIYTKKEVYNHSCGYPVSTWRDKKNREPWTQRLQQNHWQWDKLINVIERDQHTSTFNTPIRVTWTQKRILGVVIERLQISRLRKYSPTANTDLFIYSTQIWVNLPNSNASLPTHNQLLETRNYFFCSLNT